MKTVVVGDLHLISEKDNYIKHRQSRLFMDWLTNHELNNQENKIIFLGDLMEYNCDYKTNMELVSWIDNLKFKEKIIIQGNHDCTINDSILHLFDDMNNVICVYQPTKYHDDDLNLDYLFLPHYESIDGNLIPMEERYSNLYKEDEFSCHFDCGFAHIANETQKFSSESRYCDTSKLNADCWLNGHVHTGNALDNGHYLGSVVKNSSTEKNDEKYICVLSDDKMKEFVKVPNFLSYIVCEYGEFPKIDTELGLLQVNNAPTKFDAEKMYHGKYGDKIGFTKIYTKRAMIMESQDDSNNTIDESALFDEFAKEKKLSNEIIDICKKVLQGE